MDNDRRSNAGDFLRGKMHHATKVSEVHLLARLVIKEAKA